MLRSFILHAKGFQQFFNRLMLDTRISNERWLNYSFATQKQKQNIITPDRVGSIRD